MASKEREKKEEIVGTQQIAPTAHFFFFLSPNQSGRCWSSAFVHRLAIRHLLHNFILLGPRLRVFRGECCCMVRLETPTHPPLPCCKIGEEGDEAKKKEEELLNARTHSSTYPTRPPPVFVLPSLSEVVHKYTRAAKNESVQWSPSSN